MTGGVLSNSVVGRSVFGPYACLDVTTYRIGSGFSVGRRVKVCGREACLRGAKGRCCGRPSVRLQSSLTHTWHDSRMCSKVLLQWVPDASTPRLLNALQKGCRPRSEKVHGLDVRAVRELTGSILGGEGLRFAVVAARFNEIVTRPLVAGALETFHKYAVKDEDVDLVWVPGSFEIPLVAQQMAKSGKYEAVLAIGAVIRGATTHYDAVAGSAASGLMSASLNSGVPVIFGILTTENMDQAIDRAGGKVGNKGAEAALTAIEMASLFKHQITPLRDTQ